MSRYEIQEFNGVRQIVDTKNSFKDQSPIMDINDMVFQMNVGEDARQLAIGLREAAREYVSATRSYVLMREEQEDVRK